MDKIYEELLRLGIPITITELLNESKIINKLCGGSNQKVSALMVRLVHAGRVERTIVGKKCYFAINYDREEDYE